MASSDANTFMSELDREIHAHPFLSSPFVKRLAMPDEISRAQAARFARLYYPHIFRTRLYQANALGISPDERIQFVLSQILHDEYGNGNFERTHPAVYRKFLKACGVPEKQWSIEPAFPELVLYIETMMRLTQNGDWLAAVAAVGIASEWPIPKLYGEFLKGLRTIPEIKEDDLELFVSHIGIDEEHSRLMREALLPHAETAEGRARIRAGVKANLDVRHVMLGGLYREVFGA